MWYVLIKKKKNLYSISVVLPEQVWCRTGTVKVFCNSGPPLNAHYQVSLSCYYLTIFTQHTLKGNLYHKLWNTLLSVLWVKRLRLPNNADRKSVWCFLQVVQNHSSDFSKCSLWTELKLESGREAVLRQQYHTHLKSGVMTPRWVTGWNVSNSLNCRWSPDPARFYDI